MGLQVRIELKVPSYFFLHLDFFCLHGMQCLSFFIIIHFALNIYTRMCFCFCFFYSLIMFYGFVSLSLSLL